MGLKKIKRNNNVIVVIALLILVISFSIFLHRYFNNYNLDLKNEIGIESFFYDEKEVLDDDNKETTESKKSLLNKTPYDYIAVLEIPTINLKRGLVDYSSKYNDVKYNIQIINGSTMPDVENGNLILAGHNGVGYKAFFKKLSKLNINDKIYIYYKGFKYEYKLNKFYDTPKDGNVEINRDKDMNTITLITCKSNTNDTQTVYIGYLDNKAIY